MTITQNPSLTHHPFLLGSKAIKQVVFDPLLPEPFVDVAARHAFVEMTRHFD